MSSIENLSNNGFGRGSHHIIFFHRRTGWKPSPLSNIVFNFFILFWIIFIHQPIAVSTTEVKNIIWVFLQERKIINHRVPDIFPDRFLIIPAPLSIKVGIANSKQDFITA